MLFIYNMKLKISISAFNNVAEEWSCEGGGRNGENRWPIRRTKKEGTACNTTASAHPAMMPLVKNNSTNIQMNNESILAHT